MPASTNSTSIRNILTRTIKKRAKRNDARSLVLEGQRKKLERISYCDADTSSTRAKKNSNDKASNGSLLTVEKPGIRYRECRKNHAASIGSYVVDGCREFLAAGEEGTNSALRCASCSCHRSFHKRELEIVEVCDCSSMSNSPSTTHDLK